MSENMPIYILSDSAKEAVTVCVQKIAPTAVILGSPILTNWRQLLPLLSLQAPIFPAVQAVWRLLCYPSIHQSPHFAAVVVGNSLAVAEGAIVLVIPRYGGRHLGCVVEVPAGRLLTGWGAVRGVLLVTTPCGQRSEAVGLGGAGGTWLTGQGLFVRVL